MKNFIGWQDAGYTKSNASSKDYRAAVSLCAGHVQQLGSESLLSDLMEVKD
jgi:hypothetical protein